MLPALASTSIATPTVLSTSVAALTRLASNGFFDCERSPAIPSLDKNDHCHTEGSISDIVSPFKSNYELFEIYKDIFDKDNNMAIDFAEV